ncbi:hypothetical protein NDU88_011541 [Pleurodeles waltl]|uniref:Uncharacterized protein n=1 Tax=Pleurodeles waltl TaxID=8319 RepID=A0AAV7R3N0_PLEWA|nr:hypothetical protein NDU88_011541 [Pleurodeles waltl]
MDSQRLIGRVMTRPVWGLQPDRLSAPTHQRQFTAHHEAASRAGGQVREIKPQQVRRFTMTTASPAALPARGQALPLLMRAPREPAGGLQR